jgi:ABC-type transporter Mla subunit MlaD
METTAWESIQEIIAKFFADPLALYFLYFIVGWLIIALILLNGKNRIGRRFTAITPNSLTTLGLLGTFVGVLVGLSEFDVEDIDASVPLLLEGMKIAFATSVAGIIAAIFYRLWATVFQSEDSETREITPRDIHNELQRHTSISEQNGKNSEAALAELRAAISSDKDSSLVTQVQKLRTTVDDGQKELIDEFKDFSKHMVENNQKAIIEALENVIKDFNDKLTEQFGENFKQLNQAVEKLVDWQENYKEILEEYSTKISETVEGLKESEKALLSVRESSERIPEAIDKLNPVTQLLIEQLSILDESLKAVQALREKTDNAFPEIEENLSRITNGFSESVTTLIQTSSENLALNQSAHNELQDGYGQMLSGATDARESFSKAIAETGESLTGIATTQFERIAELIGTSAENSNEQINRAWGDSAEKLSAQFENFDQQMTEELTRAMEQLGRNFASISEKFVSDYSPLADRINEIMRSTKSSE